MPNNIFSFPKTSCTLQPSVCRSAASVVSPHSGLSALVTHITTSWFLFLTPSLLPSTLPTQHVTTISDPHNDYINTHHTIYNHYIIQRAINHTTNNRSHS